MVCTGGIKYIMVWTDASSIAMRVVIQENENPVEDAPMLRKKSDSLQSDNSFGGFRTFTVATNYRVVVSWLDNTTEGRDHFRTKRDVQMLIKWQLMVIKVIITEYQLTGKFNLVPTIENKADQVACVTKKWNSYQEPESSIEAVTASELQPWTCLRRRPLGQLTASPPGVDRTFYLLNQVRSDLTRDMVKQQISGCDAC